MKEIIRNFLVFILILCFFCICGDDFYGTGKAIAESPDTTQSDVSETEETEEQSTQDGFSFLLRCDPFYYGLKLSECKLSAAGSTVTLDGKTYDAQDYGVFMWRDGEIIPQPGTAVYSAYFIPGAELAGRVFPDIPVTVTVYRALPRIMEAPKASAFEYGQRLSAVPLTGGVAVNPYRAEWKEVKGSFAWRLPDMIPGITAKEAEIVFSPEGGDETFYESVIFTVPLTIEKKKTFVEEWPDTSGTAREGQSLSEILLSGGMAVDDEGDLVRGRFVWQSPDETLLEGENWCVLQFLPDNAVQYQGFTLTVKIHALAALSRNRLHITAQNAWKYKGMEDPTLLYVVEEPQGDWILEGSLSREAGEEVGDYIILSGSLQLGEICEEEYEIVYTPGIFSIVSFVPEEMPTLLPLREGNWLGAGDEPYIAAPEGFLIGLDPEDEFAELLPVPEQSEEVSVYLQAQTEEVYGAISEAVPVLIQWDLVPPVIEALRQEGFQIVLAVSDRESGLKQAELEETGETIFFEDDPNAQTIVFRLKEGMPSAHVLLIDKADNQTEVVLSLSWETEGIPEQEGLPLPENDWAPPLTDEADYMNAQR